MIKNCRWNNTSEFLDLQSLLNQKLKTKLEVLKYTYFIYIKIIQKKLATDCQYQKEIQTGVTCK